MKKIFRKISGNIFAWLLVGMLVVALVKAVSDQDWLAIVGLLAFIIFLFSMYDVFIFLTDRNKRHKGESWRQFRQRSIKETNRYMELRVHKGSIDVLTPLHVYLRLDCGHIHYVLNDPDASLKPGDTFWCHAHHWFRPAELQHITAVEKGYDLTPEELNSVKV